MVTGICQRYAINNLGDYWLSAVVSDGRNVYYQIEYQENDSAYSMILKFDENMRAVWGYGFDSIQYAKDGILYVLNIDDNVVYAVGSEIYLFNTTLSAVPSFGIDYFVGTANLGIYDGIPVEVRPADVSVNYLGEENISYFTEDPYSQHSVPVENISIDLTGSDIIIGIYNIVTNINNNNESGDAETIESMGGFAENMYWYAIVYIPIIMTLLIGIGYFIEKKLVIKKLMRYKK